MTARKRLSALLAAEPEVIERLLGVFETPAPGVVSTPEAAAAIVRPLLAGRETEALVAIALDRRRRVIETAMLTEGSDAFTVVCSRQILRWCLTRKRSCNGLILAHNHPSGDPAPSPQDREVTRRVAHAGRVVGIPLLDHIVIGDGTSFRSLAADGDLPIYSDDPLL